MSYSEVPSHSGTVRSQIEENLIRREALLEKLAQDWSDLVTCREEIGDVLKQLSINIRVAVKAAFFTPDRRLKVYMNIVTRNPADLIPYEKNAKKHSKPQIERVAESIKGGMNPAPVVKQHILSDLA